MKILLFGKNGQVGGELRRSLSLLGEVISFGSGDCDLRDEHQIKKCIRDNLPDIIVNAAAYTDVDRAETEIDRARLINSWAPGLMAREAKRLGAFIVHYSTDYVFDGTQCGLYSEDDKPNPINVYGQTKFDGENYIIAESSKHLIIRTSWVYGIHGKNFVRTILNLGGRLDEAQVVADNFGVPTAARMLADVSQVMVREILRSVKCDSLFGLFHVVPSGVTNWNKYARYVINRARIAGVPLRLNLNSIVEIKSAEYRSLAKRPNNSLLDTNKVRNRYGLYLPEWNYHLDQFLDDVLQIP